MCLLSKSTTFNIDQSNELLFPAPNFILLENRRETFVIFLLLFLVVRFRFTISVQIDLCSLCDYFRWMNWKYLWYHQQQRQHFHVKLNYPTQFHLGKIYVHDVFGALSRDKAFECICNNMYYTRYILFVWKLSSVFDVPILGKAYHLKLCRFYLELFHILRVKMNGMFINQSFGWDKMWNTHSISSLLVRISFFLESFFRHLFLFIASYRFSIFCLVWKFYYIYIEWAS